MKLHYCIFNSPLPLTPSLKGRGEWSIPSLKGRGLGGGGWGGSLQLKKR